MTSFVHVEYPKTHPGVNRFETAVSVVGGLRRGFDGARTLAAVLLASVASAMIVVADQLVDSWADGHLLLAWVLLWAIGFAVLALFAQSAKRFSTNLLGSLDAWSAGVARRRADERLWNAAQNDPRVMADLQAALSRHEGLEGDVAILPQTEFLAAVNRARGR